MEKLRILVHAICVELKIPCPKLELDHAVGDTLGVTYLDTGIIKLEKTSVVTTMHELAHWSLHWYGLENSEHNARLISLRSFFEVWPEKRGRSDILYQNEPGI